MTFIRSHVRWLQGRRLFAAACLAGLTLTAFGCNNRAAVTNPTDNAADDNVLLNESLGNEGSVSGKVADTVSTRDSLSAAAGQTTPVKFDTTDAVVRFNDLVGNGLRGPSGDPHEGVSLEEDGSFAATGLPVGVDFTICIDIGRDGTCDIEGTVNIPSTDGGDGAGAR